MENLIFDVLEQPEMIPGYLKLVIFLPWVFLPII